MTADEPPRADDSAPEVLENRIELASVPDFVLGKLSVRPSLREVAGEGWSETIEPRVMEVLVALAGAKGAVVSRRRLIELCWDGRTVSDDAIERCIARIRKIAGRVPEQNLAIETIPRVGYRLIGSQQGRPLPTEAVWALPGNNRFWQGFPPAKWWAYSGLAAVGLLTVVYLVEVGTPSWSVASLRMLATPVSPSDPSLAPNGSAIAYAAEARAGGARHIFVRNLSVGDSVQVTNGPDSDSAPVWSPASDRIAFVRQHDGRPCEIIIRAVPAGPETSIARCEIDETTRLAWSPNGTHLYFSDRREHTLPDRIIGLDLASGTRSFITNPDKLLLGDFFPTPSPDGTRLAFERLDGGDLLVYVADLATGTTRQIGNRESDARGIAWSSDSSTLFVALERPSGSAIWAFSLSEGTPKRITLDSLQYGQLTWGGTNLLAFESRNERFSIAAVAPGPAVVAAETQPADVQHGLPDQLDVSSDGSYVASVGDNGDEALWVRHPGQPWRKLDTTTAVALFNPRWSPDGRRIAYAAIMPSGKGVFIVSPDGGYPRLAVPIAIDLVNPQIWSQDGGSLLIPVFSAKGWRIWKTNVDGRRRSVPISDWGWCSLREVGGNLYASRADRGGIWRLGEPPVLVFAGLHADRCYDWSMTAQHIAYLDRTDASMLRLVTHSLQGGNDSSVPVPGLPIDGAGTSPFALDPRTGQAMYLRTWNENSIGLLTLGQMR